MSEFSGLNENNKNNPAYPNSSNSNTNSNSSKTSQTKSVKDFRIRVDVMLHNIYLKKKIFLNCYVYMRHTSLHVYQVHWMH